MIEAGQDFAVSFYFLQIRKIAKVFGGSYLVNNTPHKTKVGLWPKVSKCNLVDEINVFVNFPTLLKGWKGIQNIWYDEIYVIDMDLPEKVFQSF